MTNQRLRDRGYTPGLRELPALLEALESADRADAKDAERALLRAQHPLLPMLAQRYDAGSPNARSRLTRLAARRATEEPELALAFLAARLEDSDPRVRRAAVSGLGRVATAASADALLAIAERETDATVARELVGVLARTGAPGAPAAIAQLHERGLARADDPQVERAAVVLQREQRADAAIALDRAPPYPLAVLVHCRPGLEPIVEEELRSRFGAEAEPSGAGELRVRVSVAPARLLECRTLTTFGFLVERPRGGEPVTEACASLVASDEVWTVLSSFTAGAPRYRLSWKSKGKKRRLLWDVVLEAQRQRPALLNDPSEAPWEIRVSHDGPTMVAELFPRFEDPRFTHRRREVPAASHPTVAAALCRVAAPRREDVVWDPFVGSGLELCELWLATAPRQLVGSDIDRAALSAARENLTAVGAERFDLRVFDVDEDLGGGPFGPENPTLIITNPPFGRRVGRSEEVHALLERFVERAARALAPGGRLVWISPFRNRSEHWADRAGLTLVRSHVLDLGGIEGTLQRFDKLSASSRTRRAQSKKSGARPGTAR